MATVPTIDLSGFASGSAEERRALADEFDAAFRTVGFCLLSGYEELLPAALISEAREAAAAFFAQPLEEKKRAYHDGIFGYLGPGAENVAATAGAAAADPDPVESLNLPGYQEPGSEWDARPQGSECPWRRAPYAPDGLEALHRYWSGATSVMLQLMALSELALGVPRRREA